MSDVNRVSLSLTLAPNGRWVAQIAGWTRSNRVAWLRTITLSVEDSASMPKALSNLGATIQTLVGPTA
jgi:hypothetical protein